MILSSKMEVGLNGRFNGVVKRLKPNERFDEVFEVSESNYLGKIDSLLSISSYRMILLSSDRKRGVAWMLETTCPVKVEQSNFSFKPWSKFVFKSTIPNSEERFVVFNERKTAGIVETIFKANLAYKEYDTVYINNRNNILAVFTEECQTVIRFSSALSMCSKNPKAMFIWLMSMVCLFILCETQEDILPLVKRQLTAAANEWTKLTIGNVAIDNTETLEIISGDKNGVQFYQQLARQIASFFTGNSIMKSYCGAIPLLDAYYYYGKATANDLKTPGLRV